MALCKLKPRVAVIVAAVLRTKGIIVSRISWMISNHFNELKILEAGSNLGPVVQSIVSLMSSLRGQLFKCFTILRPKTLIFFVEKMREAFAMKSFSYFFYKNIGVFEILKFEILTKR